MPRYVANVPATSHFNFLSGSFALNNFAIPYFVTTIGILDAARDLHLTSEIPGGESIAWSLDELYQRDIDWKRVQRNILPYLRNASAPQFFNSITIALLPFDSKKGEVVQRFSTGGEWVAPTLEKPERFGKITNLGPVTFGFWDDWADFTDDGFQSGQLRWNTQQVFGVAIDGQHRLASIKELAESSSGSSLDNTQLPIIFLIFDEKLGFKSPSKGPIVDLLRQLFIDLNKHAQGVSRARQILLDDRDPHAVSVRAILQPELSDSFNSLNATPPLLPLSLVDWHSEQAKFDQGPYLTTVLGLDWIVGEVLQTKPIGDWTDYRAVTKQIIKLRDRLGIDMSEALNRVEDLQNVKQSPFSYSDAELERVGTGFSSVWGSSMLLILTEFQPYADMISKRIHEGSVSLEFQHWFQLHQAHLADRQFEGKATQEYRKFLGRMLDREHPISEAFFKSMQDAVDGTKLESLAFNVVFQRALFSGYLEYVKLDASDISELSEWGIEYDFTEMTDDDFANHGILDGDVEDTAPDDVSEIIEEATLPSGGHPNPRMGQRNHKRASEFVDSLNRALTIWPELLNIDCEFTNSEDQRTYLWQGTLRKPEGGIDFTQGASMRARDLLFMVAAMCLYDDLRDPDQESNFEVFWDDCLSTEAPVICKAVGRAIKRYCDREGTSSAAGRILSAAGVAYELNDARAELQERLSALWVFLEL
ncbi:MAG: hypothetical protein HHJ11_19030 [Phycicoccus sp.]|nr:hypothetical protein [Phycicoccus sp.]